MLIADSKTALAARACAGYVEGHLLQAIINLLLL